MRLQASPFVRPFLSEVRGWEQKLSLIGACLLQRLFSMCDSGMAVSLQSFRVLTWPVRPAAGECIEVWMLVQRKWMYLESIFVGR